jgi:tryptophan-rich sensory protein
MAIPTWYATLNKPMFSPPNWLFGPVWTALYFLMGVSLFLVWKQGFKKKQVKSAVKVFLFQLVVNFLWSILFFGLQSPLLGLIDIVLMLGLIIYSIKLFYPISKIAAYLLVPYLLWVSFATLLNLFILILN